MNHPIYIITLWLTDQCNLNCSYCYVKKSDTKMTAETARKAIDYFYSQPGFDDRTLQISFFGGEPLLSLDVIEETAEYCSFLQRKEGRRYQLSLTTNGTLLNKSNLEFFRKNRFALMLSLDGSEEMHNRRRPFFNGQGSYEKVTQGIAMAKQHFGNIDIRYTVEPEDKNLAENIFAMIDENVNHLIFSPVLQADWNSVCSNGRLLTEFKKLGDKIISELRKGKVPPLQSLMPLLLDNARGYFRKNKFNHPCYAGLTAATVFHDGSVFPCKHFKGLNEWKIGDVHNGIDESGRQNFIKIMEQEFPFCKDCPEKTTCSGPCVADLVLYSGSFSKPYLPFCIFVKYWRKMARYIHSTLSLERNYQFNKIISQISPYQQCNWQ